MEPKLLKKHDGPVLVVEINRPEARNAVDRETADLLVQAFIEFENDDRLKVAVLAGTNGTFCAGADLKAISADSFIEFPPLKKPIDKLSEDGPMGPTYMHLSKPVIAAVSGYAVAGGLELATWCDLRVMEVDATFGVFCRRWGVPLIDGGTVRLPRLIGHSNALDMILTGRAVGADEAKSMGLANRVVPKGLALTESIRIAKQIASFPQECMKNDRHSTYMQWGMSLEDAMIYEGTLGRTTINSGETRDGATRFKNGSGRSGSFDEFS